MPVAWCLIWSLSSLVEARYFRDTSSTLPSSATPVTPAKMSSNNLPSFLTRENMIIQPPTTTNSILNFPSTTIASDAKETHILVHPRYPDLLSSFLTYKRIHGSSYEQALDASLTWQELAARFINARPLTFMGRMDYTLLRDGTELNDNDRNEWDSNGTAVQHLNSQLSLKDYLSYDEIMLSSLLAVSGPSFFINTGDRLNCAIPAQAGTFQPRGIIVGLVGARFERKHRMDSVHILRPPANRESIKFPLQDPAVSRMIESFFGAPRDPTLHFDVLMYKARIRIAADMFLLEADARAGAAGKKAWAYVVGLGLGVWQHHHQQSEWYVAAFGESIAEDELAHVGTIEFAYIPLPGELQKEIIDIGERKGIRVLFSRRNPAEKLHGDELLVLSYAWDGNAFPGNEYWTGSLQGSGDPAAACMSTVGELHSPLVNAEFTERVKIAGCDGHA